MFSTRKKEKKKMNQTPFSSQWMRATDVSVEEVADQIEKEEEEEEL